MLCLINCCSPELHFLSSIISLIIKNDAELFALKENYAAHIIEGMDVDSLAQMAYDLLLDAYRDCTEDEMIEEIKDL